MFARRTDLVPGKSTIGEEPPAVILMCPECQFDYTVSQIDTLAGGVFGYMWSCQCGTRFVPPGGPFAEILSR